MSHIYESYLIFIKILKKPNKDSAKNSELKRKIYKENITTE